MLMFGSHGFRLPFPALAQAQVDTEDPPLGDPQVVVARDMATDCPIHLIWPTLLRTCLRLCTMISNYWLGREDIKAFRAKGEHHPETLSELNDSHLRRTILSNICGRKEARKLIERESTCR